MAAATVTWRPAKALLALRDAVDALAPDRDRSSDGILGDLAHQARASDHNPNAAGVVQAIDISHDPAHGVDTYALAELLRQRRDRRIAYVISNRRIVSATVSPWEWRPYEGSNQHSHHMHVSLRGDPALYDDASPWDIALSPADPAAAPARPRLRRGATGPLVEEVQRRLGIAVDGRFGGDTEIAVAAFQAARGLGIDGIVGPYTWDALEQGGAPLTRRHEGITATVFGGAADPNRGAYDGRPIDDAVLGVALPWRFPGPRPQVRVMHGGREVVCSIVDVGPWNTDDPYWQQPGGRPQAESGTDTSGRRTNRAGIDLTPAAARVLGLAGKGLVAWEFVAAVPAQEPHPAEPTPQPIPHPVPEPIPEPAPSPAEELLADITAAIRPILEKRMSEQLPATRVVPLDDVLKLLLAQAHKAGPAPAAPAADAPVLSPIDKILGGKALVGTKAITGLLGAIGTLLAGRVGAIDPSGIPFDVLVSVFAALGGAGVLAKIDRAIRAITTVAPRILDVADRLATAIERQQAGGGS